MTANYLLSTSLDLPQIKQSLPRIRVKTDVPKIDLKTEFEIIWDFDFKK